MEDQESHTDESSLQRSVTLPQLMLFGMGTMVGGGIYALLGKVGGEAGMLAPASFLLAGLLAAVNGCAFGELASRMPYSAGEAHFVQQAFRSDVLSSVIGWLVVTTGVTSASTLAVASVGFLGELLSFPKALGIVGLVIAMGLVAIWGIVESIYVVGVITLVEVAALVAVVISGTSEFTQLTGRWRDMVPGLSSVHLVSWVSGAFLAFYAFVGFEDMVNISEEVRRPRRNMPLGIISSVGLCILLYVAASVVAVLAVPPETLAAAATPFAVVLEATTGVGGTAMIAVSLLTGLNGALVQIIMASRVMFGMAQVSAAPGWFARVHPRYRTPARATVASTALVMAFSLWLPLETLAKATSAVILVVFTTVNLSLLRIRLRGDPLPDKAWQFPLIVPVTGGLACIALLAFQGIQLWRGIG